MRNGYHIQGRQQARKLPCLRNDLPTEQEIIKIIKELDANKSSCVESISARFCIDSMLSVPEKIRLMVIKSMLTGEIPLDWTKGIILVLPKDGDLLNPSNWRPITQTSIFAKVFRKGYKNIS